ncbi:glutamate--cysteine ligase [Corynebacterium sp. TAE3-ERU16]|uniref:glutamate--cysteine ligase n=1 Tax=Corynebacterium sp. TAE3-ERU16 TaxID=2849493 RepID=UPI001C45423B|nr:glutamate--cysteine ligase [Corynebacterium sp. TAE3-ERU16]MBV7293624.1 glutamate--cysteine ligase [Corynebacterium sp. TAE3-ERU16]
MADHMNFNRSPEPTLGVEWEIGLIDPETRDLTPRAADMIKLMSARRPDLQLEPEFLKNTVEMVTGVCHTVPEAVAELSSGLDSLRECADEMGVRLWSAGSHPFSDWREQEVSDKSPYTEIIRRTRFWGRQMLIWGLHVHVGVSHEAKVWPIINALMTNYPHLLALSAGSPGWNGLDTGYASNRTMLYQQLPTAGAPYGFNTWSQWTEYLRQQDKSGVIDHTGSMHFDIRPSAKWGTIEVRVSDAPSNLRELAALTALTHCLVVYYDRAFEAGETLPSLQPWHVRENKWRAARYGMEADIICSRNTDTVSVVDDIRRIVGVLEPLAGELGCAAELDMVHGIIDRGAAYRRQRKLMEKTGDWRDVVDLTCTELVNGRP